MVKNGVIFLILVAFVISLSGCATAKRKDMEIQGLRNQVSLLEAQVQSKEAEIASLRDTLSRSAEEKEVYVKEASRKSPAREIKSRPNIKQIQIALMNAGYNPGRIDGRMGKQTRDAIKDFQRASNLKVDGHVGKKTWGLLGQYLYKKIK